jgi:DNA-binding transcriptional LysR family regulator
MASTRLVARTGRRIKLRDLHIVLTVAECGSLIKAARELAVSPPVISKTISELEAELGVRLFDRDRHGAEPTAYGRALVRRSVAAFDELRQGISEIESLADPTVGDVRIGGHAAMMAGLLPAVIGQLRLKYPRLTVQAAQTLMTPALYDNLRNRTFDLIIGRLQIHPLDGDLVSETLFDEPVSIVAGLSSPWARRRKIALADLIGEPWILPQRGTQVGSIVGDIFPAHGLPEPAAPVVCSSIEMYWGLLATGRFIAALPLSLLTFATQRNTIKVLPIKVKSKSAPVGIVTLRNRTLSPGARVFIEHARVLSLQLR